METEPQEVRQARQRASVKWLLSKAFNNRVPDNLKEPFYRDHENQERLKPQIIVELGNATLYCQTLSNLYSDPNYQSLNHWSILQTLSRKGVPVSEPDVPITETVLIQTNPLRINAHMSVIESLMILYAKEISTGDRILNAIRRISGSSYQAPPGQSHEQLLLAWVSHVCAALKKRIAMEVEAGITDDNGTRLHVPDIPPIRDFQDLCDGICLALLVCFYCPKVVSWTSVRINYLPAVEDSINNVLIVSNFSQKYLPYSVFHMTPEDLTYMRGSMKLNLAVLLADMFNLFEIHPAKCVNYQGMESPVIHSDTTSKLSTASTDFHQNFQTNNFVTSNGAAFVVHKSRGITTLSSMQTAHQQQPQEPLVPARLRQAKEKSNIETKADERGDYAPAGRPSNWEQTRRPSYAGRRSRRNSSSEDSQLTIENFGGSQDQLNVIGHYDRDRDRDRERERKISNVSAEPAVAVRSSIADARGTLQLGYDTDSGSEKQDHETEKFLMRRQESVDNVSLLASNAQLNSSVQPRASPLQGGQKQCSTERDFDNESIAESRAGGYDNEGTPVRKISQGSISGKSSTWYSNQNDVYDDDLRSLESQTKLNNVRLKLEEKRRRIELDKRKIELALMRHQEKDDLESCADTSKWEVLSNDSKRSPDMDAVDLEKYQQSVAIMNMNLQDIQQDIQRLASQQSQIQAQQMQAQQLMQAQQISNMLNQQSYGSQQHLADHFQQRSMFGSTPHLPQAFNPPVNAYNSRPPSRDPYQQQMHANMPMQYVNEHGQYMSPPQQPPSHIMQTQGHFMQPQSIYSDTAPYNNHYIGGSGPQYLPHHMQQQQPQFMGRQSAGYDDYTPYHGRDPNSPQANHFYVHDGASTQTPGTQRRTWAQSYEQQQQQPQPMVDVNAWQSQKQGQVSRSDDTPNYWGKQTSQQQQGFVLHHNGNGGGGELKHLFQTNASPQHSQRNTSGDKSVQRQHSSTNLRDNKSPNAMPRTTIQQPPTDDMMAPQSICFIGDEDDVDEIERSIIASMQSARISTDFNRAPQVLSANPNDEMANNKLNITSGNLTYRIPSPSRPSLHANSFQDPREERPNEKGFYISFDDEQPKRPKPPLRAKRSPKKEKSLDSVDHKPLSKRESLSQLHNNIAATGNEALNGNYMSANKNLEKSTATYNKYTDAPPPVQLRQLVNEENSSNSQTQFERRHLDDLTNQPHSPTQISSAATRQNNENSSESKGRALVIGTDVDNLDPDSVDEMERRKEKIMLLSLQRRQQQEEVKARKEIEAAQRREREREKEEERARKKEEQMARRAAILEQHRLKKAIEEAEREGKTLDRTEHSMKQQSQSASVPRLRSQRVIRPRPKTIHVDDGSVDISEASSISSRGKKGSNTNLTGYSHLSSNSMRRDYYKGSQDSLTVKESPEEYPSTSSTPIGRRGSYKTSREPTAGERGRNMSRISVAKGSSLNFRGRKSNSLMNLCGPKLYKQPAAKSNRGIILNAVEYCVFPGAVNRDAKQKVLEKIARSEAKHFLILFRDAGCQFRALYSYVPETEQVCKLFGTGPSQVDEVMFDKFFKYNSGGKCFSQVHTKHLTVTIDAFTIHNSLWQGKKVHLPSKKDMALVI